MRKHYISLLFIMFSFAGYSGEVVKTYHFASPKIIQQGIYQSIQFPNTQLTGIPGEPALPYLAIDLELPAGEIADHIDLVYGQVMIMDGRYTLYPQQQSQPISKATPNGFTIHPEVYKSDNPYPKFKYGQLNTQFLRGVGHALTTITPVVYYPSIGKIGYCRDITVKITTRPDPKAAEAAKMAKSTSANPDDYQLLIITSSTYIPEMQIMAYGFYQLRGLKTQIADVNTITTSMTGYDDPEKIRNYIKQEYQQHNIQYVLIGGDVDVVPVRGFFCHVISGSGYEDDNIPSDLYYSALDGNWDSNNNHIYGEIGEEDFLPEVSVGRLPFKTMAEFQTMKYKIVHYSDFPVLGELNKVFLVGEKLMDNPLTWGGDYLDLLIGAQDTNGYATTGFPASMNIEKMYDRDLPQPWDPATFRQKVNEGKPFINHVGHANTDYILRMYTYEINDQAFSGANGIQHNYNVLYSHGCYSGAFDLPDCISQKMLALNNFLVCFIGNSRYGWFNEGQTEGPSEHLNREFINALYTDGYYRVGDAHMHSRIKSAAWVNAPGQWEEGALRWCFYDCNVLGDPTLSIWSQEPQPLIVTYPPQVPVLTPSIIATVIYGGNPLPGLTCTILSSGGSVLSGSAVTDSIGQANINIDIPIAATGMIYLVVSGPNILTQTFQIQVTPTTGTGTVVSSSPDVNLTVFPNPVHDQLIATFNLDQPRHCIMEICNFTGQRVVQLLDKSLSAGNQQFNFSNNESLRNLENGIYFIRLITNNQVINKRFMILK